MKKLFIIIIILLLFSVMVSAKLSDETLKIVETLKFKQYNLFDELTTYGSIDSSDYNFVYEWISISFEDGKLFVETQDGKWFIEMEKVEE